jgi:hypothetical protein
MTIHKKCHGDQARRVPVWRGVSRLKRHVLPDEAAFSAGILRG